MRTLFYAQGRCRFTKRLAMTSINMRKIIEAAIAAASGEVGVRETGQNRGARVEEYLRAAGLPPGEPWCAAFVWWCIAKASAKVKLACAFPKTGYCPAIAKWAERNGRLHSEPKRGDVFLVRGKKDGVVRFFHTGFVAEVVPGGFETIEGNTGPSGTREGIGVFRRRRGKSSSYAFVRWA